MDAIERAIRSAFQKGNAEDRAFREKVYRSAFGALDRALQGNPKLTVETAIRRRRDLQTKITEIESEFIPAAPAIDMPASDLAPVEPDRADPAVSASPAPEIRVTGQEASSPSIDVSSERAAPGPATPPGDRIVEVAPDRNEARVRERRRRPYGVLFIIVTLLALVGIGGWWAVQTGMFKTLAERGQLANPPATIESEDFVPEETGPAKPGEADAQRDWINVFSPADPSLVNSPADTTAEVMQDVSGNFMRIRSSASGSAIVFDVGQGVLERLAGKRATFDIVARAEEGKETEMSIDCNFGELGDCGRKRYAVGYEKGDYLFEIDFPAKKPGAGGTIAINSDFSNQGKGVDVYEIKVSVAK